MGHGEGCECEMRPGIPITQGTSALSGFEFVTFPRLAEAVSDKVLALHRARLAKLRGTKPEQHDGQIFVL